ncbi:nucleocapsid protein N [Pterostylis blotch virus]|nr:nucleocapsid protein N [Pterostylis blotch virus]ULN99186.1 nucleocapsid protein N [Pterostylis blotch virus]ULN99191.1 nucleocapsid protein N [Pterostylis blotch virus]
MSNAGLTKETLENLLKFNTEIDVEQQDTGNFTFSAFYSTYQDAPFNITNACSIIRNRKKAFEISKTGGLIYNNMKIVDGASATSTDFTFKRLETYLRVRLINAVKSSNGSLKTIQKLMSTAPLLRSYGFNMSSTQISVRMGLIIGGNLPLLASCKGLESESFALAFYQNLKKEDLGIKNFSTIDQLAKVALVLKSKDFVFTADEKNKLKNCLNLLKECNPANKASVALDHYKDILEICNNIFEQ